MLPLIFCGCFFSGGPALAAELTWTGATSVDWNTGTNWSTGVVPTAADNVTIPDAGTTNNDPSVSAGALCGNLILNAGGVLNGNAQTLAVFGSWTNNGTFNHGNGKVVFRGNGNATFAPGGSQYYDLELDKVNYDDLLVSGTATVLGDFTQTDGELNGGQLDLAGNYVIGAAANGISPNSGATYTTINLNGDGDQSLLYSAGGIGGCVRIDKASGTVDLPGDVAVNGWIYVQGAVTGLDSHRLIFGDDQNGTFTPGALAYGDVEISRFGSYDNLNVTAAATINGDLIHTSGDVRGGQLDLAGDYVIGASADGASGNAGWPSAVVNFNGAGDQAVVYSAGGIGLHLRVDKASGTLSIASDITVCGWTYVQGVITGLDAYKLIFGDDQHDTFTPGTFTYHDLQLNKAGGYNELRLSGTATLTGDFIHTNGQLDSGQLDLSAGNYVIEAGAEGLSSYSSTEICYVNFSGAGDQAIVYSAGGVGTNVRVDKPSGTLIVASDITVNGWTYVRGAVAGLDAHKLVFGGAQNSTFTPGSFVYTTIELYKPNGYETLNVLGTATLTGDFIQTHGAIRLGQFDLAGNYVVGADASGTSTYSGTAATIINFNAAGDQAILVSAGGIAAHIRVDKPAGTLTVSGEVTACSWTYVRGEVVGMSTYKLILGDDYHGVFAPGSLTYKEIEVNKNGGYDDLTFSADTLTVSGNLTFTDGEIKLNANDPVVNVAGNVVIGANALVFGSSNSITVRGSWTNAGVFSHGYGKVVFGGVNADTTPTLTSGASAFYDLELNKTNDYGFYDNFIVAGTVEVARDLIHTDGDFRDGQINVAGNYIIGEKSGGAPSGSTPTIVNLNGTGNQAIVYAGLGVGDNVRVDKASGTLSVDSNIKVNGWNYVRGTVAGLDEHVLIFGDDMLGYFVPGERTYTYVEINKTSHNGIYDNVTISGTVNLTGNLLHTEGELNGGQINLTAGNYVVPATADGSQSGSASTIINFNGEGDQSVVYSAGGVAAHIRVDKPSGALTIADGLIVHDWTYVRGNVPNLDIYTLVLGDNGSGYFTPGAVAYGNLEIYKTEHNGVYDDVYLTAGALPTIRGSLYLREGQLRLDSNNPSLHLGGDLTIGSTSATFTKGTGTLTFDGTDPAVFTDNGATPQNLGKVVLQKTNADPGQNTLALASGLTCDTFTVGAGNTLALGVGGHVLTLANAGALSNVLTLAGNLEAGEGTVRYAATNSAGNINVAPAAYHGLEVAGAETYVLAADMNIDGTLTIGAAATLDTAAFDLTLAGDLNNAGTFMAGTNAVILDGTDQALSGNTTFYDLNKTVIADDTLTFAAGSTTAVSHELTLRGVSRDQRLTLQSSVPGSVWNLNVDPLAAYDFDSLAVSDSVASRNLASLNSLDQGSNLNWSLTSNTAPALMVPTVSPDRGVIAIAATVSDTDADNLNLKVEYSLDGGATWLDPFLTAATATAGTPTLDNASAYQLSGISTVSSNTLNISWDTDSEDNQAGRIEYAERAKVRLTPFDGTDYGTAQISALFTVDNRPSSFIVPTKPNLGGLKITPVNGKLSFVGLPVSVTQVAVSRSPDFTNASFEDLSLLDVSGYTGILYLKFRTRGGAVSDTLEYGRVSGAVTTLLLEGDIAKSPDSFDVYIIKYKSGKQYKRLILSPSVFASYQHLKWGNLKVVSQAQLDSYTTSSLVQVAGDPSLYQLTPLGDTGRRRSVTPTETYDPDSVYEINRVDRDSYVLDN